MCRHAPAHACFSGGACVLFHDQPFVSKTTKFSAMIYWSIQSFLFLWVFSRKIVNAARSFVAAPSRLFGRQCLSPLLDVSPRSSLTQIKKRTVRKVVSSPDQRKAKHLNQIFHQFARQGKASFLCNLASTQCSRCFMTTVQPSVEKCSLKVANKCCVSCLQVRRGSSSSGLQDLHHSSLYAINSTFPQIKLAPELDFCALKTIP